MLAQNRQISSSFHDHMFKVRKGRLFSNALPVQILHGYLRLMNIPNTVSNASHADVRDTTRSPDRRNALVTFTVSFLTMVAFGNDLDYHQDFNHVNVSTILSLLRSFGFLYCRYYLQIASTIAMYCHIYTWFNWIRSLNHFFSAFLRQRWFNRLKRCFLAVFSQFVSRYTDLSRVEKKASYI